MRTKIIYYAHGTTFDNAAGRSSGWKNVELNELGIEQSKALAEQTKNIKFDVYFTSDLKRAIDTADYAWPGVEKIQDKRLRECNYGDLDGQASNLVVYEDHIYEPFPNGESMQDVEKRIAEFLDFIKTEYKGKTIAVVMHKATQFAFEVLINNVSWEEAIKNDWRERKAWQPGWEYYLD